MALNENRLDVAERILKPYLKEDPFDAAAMLTAADKAMARRGWERTVCVMQGREVVLGVKREPVPLGDPVLALRDCSGDDARGHRTFRRVSFAVRRGEVLAIVGVAGNGQRELVSAITGAGRFSS